MFSPRNYDRFGGRGRGRAGYIAARRDHRQGCRSSAHGTPRSHSPPVGRLLTTICSTDLKADQITSSDARITRVEDVASYNWLRANEPTIMVPGKPPKWTPTASPTKLAEDNPNATYYRDPNAAFFPSYPMEPVVRSIFEARPDFNSQEIEVFACGSTLGNLLRFARNVETEKPFRFLVEVVGHTVFLIRRENSPKEAIADIRGYGHSFPEANTTWDADVQSSETHQRIIRYQLGHLHTIVRFEADGYLTKAVSAKETYDLSASQELDETALISALAENTISAHTSKNSNSLTVIRGRGSVPRSAVLDLKTRSIKKKQLDTTLSEQIPRLWIRQIPFLVLAYHERGLFRSEEVVERNIEPEVAKWELDNKQDVLKLIALITKIADVVKATPARKLEVRYRPGHELELRHQVEGVAPVLPVCLAAQWANIDKKHDDALEDDEYDWDLKEDYTACSMESCKYCGRCSY